MKIEFERLVVEDQRRVDMMVGGVLVCTSAGRDGTEAVQACREELAKWNAEEPEKLERYTDRELRDIYEEAKAEVECENDFQGKYPESADAGVRAVATAVLEREQAIFAQMSEEELLNRVRTEFQSSEQEAMELIALVRQFDAAKLKANMESALKPNEPICALPVEKPATEYSTATPKLGPGWRPMEELRDIPDREYVLVLFKDGTFDKYRAVFPFAIEGAIAWCIPTREQAPVFEAECATDDRDRLRVLESSEGDDHKFLSYNENTRRLQFDLTPTKAAELARTLDPKSFEELERLREVAVVDPPEAE